VIDKKTLIFLRQAKLEKRLFFYSYPLVTSLHRGIEICFDCDTVLIHEKFRDEVENELQLPE